MKQSSISFKISIILIIILSSSIELSANEHSSNQVLDYHATFFAQYQPQNALSMIERLPGFKYDRGSNSRGFGGNAGNVLIDGVRPTSKSGGLSGALKRIPAKQIDRIQIIRGGSGNTIGQAMVANVITMKNVTSGTYAIKFRNTLNTEIQPNIEGAINTVVGQWETIVDLDIGFIPGNRDSIVNDLDSSDEIVTSANEKLTTLRKFYFFNGQLSRDFNRGKLTFNGRFGGTKEDRTQTRSIYNKLFYDNNHPESHWSLKEVNRFGTLELGIDWLQQLGNWHWHSLALGQIQARKNISNAHTNEMDVTTEFENDSSDRFRNESILRNTYGYIGNDAFKPEFGVEIARNILDSSLLSFSNGVNEDLDNADVEIEEIRAEVFARFAYGYSDTISIDGGLTAEFSTIEIIGDNLNKQDFKFIKPRIAVNYQYNENVSIFLEAQHVVKQLNFNDFAASSSTTDGRNVSGNSELKPEQRTQLQTRLDWKFSEKSSVNVKAFHHWRDDILEEIKLSSGSQGLGNAGSAKVWGYDIDITLQTDIILENGLLEFSYHYIDSKFYDPLIQRNRNISDYKPRQLAIKLRQDIFLHNLAWGVNYYGHFDNIEYLVDEIEKFEGNNRGQVFIETSYFDGYKVQLQISDFNVGKYTRTRNFFVDDRNGNFDGKEIANRRRSPYFKLSIWGTF